MRAGGRRLAAAACIVAAIVGFAPAVDAVAQAAHAGGQAAGDDVRLAASSVGIDAALFAGAGDVDEALGKLEALAAAPADDVAESFERDIGFLPGARDVRASGPVVGYLVDGGCDEVMEALQAHMAGRGWTCVPLGGIDGATFVKRSGACTWALATCTQVGDATSVVVRSDAT